MKVTPVMRLLAPLAGMPLVQNLMNYLSRPKTRPPYGIENEFFRVGLDQNDKTLILTEKATGRVYRGLNRFVDSGDCGDEYNFSPPAEDSVQKMPALRDVTITRGPVQQVMTISLVLTVPESLSADRTSRSAKMIELPIVTTVTLTSGVSRVDVHTRVDNRAKDHRLRVHFPAYEEKFGAVDYDGHFEVLSRPVGLPKFDSTWAEAPRPETHQRAFTSVVTDGGQRLTIANRGLPEVEVTPQSEIALTLLRCVGWLSRDDFSTRNNHAGPFLETPKAQMPGEWDFDYSIIVSGEFQQAWNFDAPLCAAMTDVHEGMLRPSGSFVNVDSPSFVVSAVKETDDGRGWIVRGYNVRGEDVEVTLTPWRKFKKAERVSMSEETVSKLKVGGGGEVKVTAKGYEVVTVMFT
jgi:alpha-mannosidase